MRREEYELEGEEDDFTVGGTLSMLFVLACGEAVDKMSKFRKKKEKKTKST